MKINFNKNTLKTTISGNVYAICSLISLFIFLYIEFNSRFFAHKTGDITIVFEIFFAYVFNILFFFLCLIIFIVELIFNHRIKNKFFIENKLYNSFFYIVIVLNICLIILFTAV